MADIISMNSFISINIKPTSHIEQHSLYHVRQLYKIMLKENQLYLFAALLKLFPCEPIHTCAAAG
jgi:hypothetical protein